MAPECLKVQSISPACLNTRAPEPVRDNLTGWKASRDLVEMGAPRRRRTLLASPDGHFSFGFPSRATNRVARYVVASRDYEIRALRLLGRAFQLRPCCAYVALDESKGTNARARARVYYFRVMRFVVDYTSFPRERIDRKPRLASRPIICKIPKSANHK